MKRTMIIRAILGILIGGSLGFLAGYYGKCQTGVCPLTSNPYISTIVGIIVGLLIALQGIIQ